MRSTQGRASPLAVGVAASRDQCVCRDPWLHRVRSTAVSIMLHAWRRARSLESGRYLGAQHGRGRAGGRRRHCGDGPVAVPRYRRGDGKESFRRWEFASDVMTLGPSLRARGSSAARHCVRFTGDEPPDVWARPTTNLVHWATGVGWGAPYGALASHNVPPAVGARTRARSGRLALRLCRASAGEGLQADLGVRRADARRRSCPRTSCTAR